VLRPLRDQMGIAGGVRNLPWMFTATFVTLLIAQPLYGALVAKLPRVRFIPIVYHFFVANLALFWLLLTLEIETEIVARVFTFGLLSSASFPLRYSGRSWPTCSRRSKPSGCSAS
jgi:ATP:ADP antiporter, AAA family